MDAIEAGLVKIPRVPVEDDASRAGEVTWRYLYKNTTPKTVKPDLVPAPLSSALQALYGHYEGVLEVWQRSGMPTPPVFIVVANNIGNAEALYHHIAGWSEPGPQGTRVFRTGACQNFSNIEHDGSGYKSELRTLLVHSKIDTDDNIGSGSKLGKAIDEQAALLSASVSQPPTNAEGRKQLLREALNTVGRIGGLGERIRCVVSVSMLTEGWDTRHVTHVLSFRAFTTQLLCEQVTGRALRRSSYDNFDENGRLRPEFADVLGVPFDFMPARGKPHSPDPQNRYTVKSLPGRSRLRVDFPCIESYVREPPKGRLTLDVDRVTAFEVSPQGPTIVVQSGIAGETELIGVEPRERREQTLLMDLAADALRRIKQHLAESGQVVRTHELFSDMVATATEWLKHPLVECNDINWLSNRQIRQLAALELAAACNYSIEDSSLRQTQIIGVFARPSVRSTDSVKFETSLPDKHDTTNSELNIAACHSDWERQVAAEIDRHPEVRAWARNFRLDWTVPYNLDHVWHRYTPDFVVRLGGEREELAARHLIVEVKSQPDRSSYAKERYVRNYWIPAVANAPELPRWLRRWHFVELSDDANFGYDLDTAIDEALAQPDATPHRTPLPRLAERETLQRVMQQQPRRAAEQASQLAETHG